MILIAYGEEGRPIQRVAEQLAKAIDESGRQVLVASAAGLPGIVSHSGPREVPTHIIGSWWLGVHAILGRIPAETRVITCVYDHETPFSHADKFAEIAARSGCVFASNAALRKEVSAALVSGGVTTPVLLMTDGVDTEALCPGSGPMDGPLRVGWCGDPSLERIKRTSMIRSACMALDGIELDFLDVRSGRAHEDMPEWYRGLDVYLCTSSQEGTPNPILEAAACGVPYISTPVGVVPALHEQTGGDGGWLIEGDNERESLIDGFRAALALRRPGLRSKGLRCRAAIVDGWTWEQRQAPAVAALDNIPKAEPEPGALKATVDQFLLPGAPVRAQRAWQRRIFVLGMTLGIGGSEKMTADMANLLRSDGYEVTVLLSVAAGGVYRESLAEDIAVEYAPDCVSMLGFIGTTAPCGVIINNVPQARNLAVSLTCPVTHITHGFVPWSLGNLARPLPMHAEVMAISDHVAEGLVAVRPDLDGRIPVIRNAVNTDRFCPEGPRADLPWNDCEGPVFLYSGRYSPEKQLPKMIDVFAGFHMECPTARLLIVGGIDPGASPEHRQVWGLNRNEVLRRAASLGVADAVVETGVITNPEDYYRAADVMLLTSMFEGLPLCVMEALACGLPVVSTAVGAIPDVVTDERALVPDMEDTGKYVAAMRIAVGTKAGKSLLAPEYGHERYNAELLGYVHGRMPRVRPKIGLVYDIEGHAFDEITQEIAGALPDAETIRVKYGEIETRLPVDCDLVFNPFYIRSEEIKARAPDAVQISCVPDHYTWLTAWGKAEIGRACANSARIVCTNERLAEEVGNATRSGEYISVCLSGVHAAFVPRKRRKLKRLVVGWAGSTQYHSGVKGVPLIREACEALGDKVELRIVDAVERRRSRREMVKFYQGLDVYVCMSSSEGTCMPLIEASACGVPVISTRVGVAAALVNGSGGAGGQIVERTADALTEALRWCAGHRRELEAQGKSARETIKQDGWDWEHRAQDYRRVIVEALEDLECG